MNRYKFQMGAELPPEMMQQMQGMPTEQGIPMEQGMPVEQGNGEASFAQQLMVIEQEIDKIQKEMKKLEKRDDKLAQNEYKRLEQQLMQLEQQKEMLRQQVEATRQQLEAQEQMQGEEYLDPNAQYEMSPEELDALEGQYQDVPTEEQINPEEMQMMQYGGKMQTGKKILNWLGQIPASETIGGQLSEVNMKNLEKDLTEGKISPKEYNARVDNGLAANLIANSMSVLPEAAVIDSDLLAYLTAIPTLGGAYLHDRATYTRDGKTPKDSPFHWHFGGKEEYEKEMKEIENAKKNTSVKKSFGGKMQWGNKQLRDVTKNWLKNGYSDDVIKRVSDYYGWNNSTSESNSDNVTTPLLNNQTDNDYTYDREPIVVTPNTRRDLRNQQRKDRLKNNIQTIKDYFGDVEPINIAQAVLPFIGALDNSHAIDNELSKNLTYSDNPYYKPLDYVNETYDSQQKALYRSYAQQSNQARRDTNRAILSLQPRSVFGRDALMTAKNIQLDEAKEKLDSSYLSGTSSLTANRNKDYSSAYDKAANINLENDQLNKALLKNFYKEEGVRRKEIYDMFQEGQNRIANIIQNKKDLAYLNEDWYNNLTAEQKANLQLARWMQYLQRPSLQTQQQKQTGK